MTTKTLTLAEVRRCSKFLREAGRQLPKAGWVGDALPVYLRQSFRTPEGFEPTELVHDAGGYYFIGWTRFLEAK